MANKDDIFLPGRECRYAVIAEISNCDSDDVCYNPDSHCYGFIIHYDDCVKCHSDLKGKRFLGKLRKGV